MKYLSAEKLGIKPEERHWLIKAAHVLATMMPQNLNVSDQLMVYFLRCYLNASIGGPRKISGAGDRTVEVETSQ